MKFGLRYNNRRGMVSQLNDLRSYSRHWLGEFIEMYQAEECLWQPKHPDYSNNTSRNIAYDKLVEKLKEVEPHPDRNMVVRKINSLRSAFRRELRKINARPNYETRLWYYDRLSFIADHGNPKRLISSTANEMKPLKRSLPLNFDDDESMEYEDEQHLEGSSVTSNAQVDIQAEVGTTTTTLTAVANGNVVTIVKSEDHKPSPPQQQQQQQKQELQDGTEQESSDAQETAAAAAAAAAALQHHHHHHQHQQQHHHAQQLQHAQTQPQHTTAVKVLEITSLDSNSQREIQQAVNSLEQQHHIQQQLQQQQQNQANQAAAAAAQLHQQVPTIQIAREHLQPLFGGTATAYTATAHSTQRPDDEYDAIGINVASKLRVMNPHQRIVAEKLISDILFNGQLDNLTINSHLTQ